MLSKDVELILDIFTKINRVPRCSKHEEKIASWLIEWANSYGFRSKRDEFNNVLIEIPPSETKKDSPSVVIQGHMDMVCEKDTLSSHDFSKDEIKTIIDGDWLRADRTTLGADNGIALAIGLALAISKIEKPKIELLFTSDEETGLNGAKHIKSDFVEGKILINVDSEDEGVFIIGCAGGEDTDIELDYDLSASHYNNAYEITIDGLLSGHSGIDINKDRANAIKLLFEFLDSVKDDVDLVLVDGGSARNAIPKSAKAVVVSDIPIDTMKYNIVNFLNSKRKEYPNEKSMTINIKQREAQNECIKKDDFLKLLNLIRELPHGVHSMLDSKITHTSNNLAKILTNKDSFIIHTNQRSLSEDELTKITRFIESIAKKYDARYTSYNRYPAWQPNKDSSLVRKSKKVYEELFGKKPIIEVIHAGLECGIIGSKFDGMDMISIGPTIKDPHTPNERLYIPSLDRIWKFLVYLLKEI